MPRAVSISIYPFYSPHRSWTRSTKAINTQPHALYRCCTAHCCRHTPLVLSADTRLAATRTQPDALDDRHLQQFALHTVITAIIASLASLFFIFVFQLVTTRTRFRCRIKHLPLHALFTLPAKANLAFVTSLARTHHVFPSRRNGCTTEARDIHAEHRSSASITTRCSGCSATS